MKQMQKEKNFHSYNKKDSGYLITFEHENEVNYLV